MAWLRIDDNVPHHRKMLAAGPAAAWLWLCGVAYCQRHTTDGHIPAEALPWLGVEKPKPLAATLVRVGLWHADGDGWRVHDFLDWNASSDERKERTEQKTGRQQRWRERMRADASTKQDVDASTSHLGDATPTPPPTPPPSPHLTAPAPPPPEGRAARLADRATTLGLVSPGAWDRQHAAHALRGELCGWVCLPQTLHDEFAARLTGAGMTLADAAAAVHAWAVTVRDGYQSRGEVVGEGSIFTFWRHEWQRTHGSNKPAAPTSLAFADPLAGVRAADERDRKAAGDDR